MIRRLKPFAFSFGHKRFGKTYKATSPCVCPFCRIVLLPSIASIERGPHGGYADAVRVPVRLETTDDALSERRELILPRTLEECNKLLCAEHRLPLRLPPSYSPGLCPKLLGTICCHLRLRSFCSLKRVEEHVE